MIFLNYYYFNLTFLALLRAFIIYIHTYIHEYTYVRYSYTFIYARFLSQLHNFHLPAALVISFHYISLLSSLLLCFCQIFTCTFFSQLLHCFAFCLQPCQPWARPLPSPIVVPLLLLPDPAAGCHCCCCCCCYCCCRCCCCCCNCYCYCRP